MEGNADGSAFVPWKGVRRGWFPLLGSKPEGQRPDLVRGNPSSAAREDIG